VLENSETNSLQDGDQAQQVGQHHRVTFGCCGQVFTNDFVDDNCVTKNTYGLDVFKKAADNMEQHSLKQMIGDALDSMQACEDFIEMVKLKNGRPCHHSRQDERFTAVL